MNVTQKTYKFRLRPTKKQARLMQATLDECRWLYNRLLEDRNNAWNEKHRGLTYMRQSQMLPVYKSLRPSLEGVYSQVLQNVAVRLDLAFKSFFRRCKAGGTPGFPRFRGKDRYDSFTYPQSGFRLEGKEIKLSKIGSVRIILHREIEGKIKTCTISRKGEKWFVCLVVEFEPQALPKSTEAVGIDVGLYSFATLSTGETIPNPRFFRKEEKALAKAQRRFSKLKDKHGTLERKKAKKVVTRVHERIANRRHNFVHQESRRIVNRFGVIFVEDLRVNRMLHLHCLAKSISDAAWSMFFGFMGYKAEWAGRHYDPQNPAYGSQDCCICHHRQKMPLGERTYVCPCCGNVIDRDHNAANNYLALGLQSMGAIPRSPSSLDDGE